jgi:hypothetical protein
MQDNSLLEDDRGQMAGTPMIGYFIVIPFIVWTVLSTFTTPVLAAVYALLGGPLFLLSLDVIYFSMASVAGAEYDGLLLERERRDGVDDRGKVQMTDVFMALMLIVAFVVTAPIWFKATAMVSGSADPFSALLLQLAPALLVIAVIVSVGVSARRRF